MQGSDFPHQPLTPLAPKQITWQEAPNLIQSRPRYSGRLQQRGKIDYMDVRIYT